MTLSPTYRTIKRTLTRQLGQTWPPGSRLPPIKELARQLGTGQVNTQRAIKELSADGLVVSRPRMGTFVAPRLDQALLDLAAGPETATPQRALSGKLVHVTHSGLDLMDQQRELYVIFADQMRQYGADVSLGRQKWSMPLTEQTTGALAVVAINPSTHLPIRLESSQPFLALSTTAEVLIDMPGGFDIVTLDEHRGGYLAGWTLRRAGCESVCFLGVHGRDQPDDLDGVSQARLHGFEQGWGAAPVRRLLLAPAYDLQCGAMLASKFCALDPRPQAVFAASDELAVGFALGMHGRGLVAGEHYQLIGFDAQHIGRQLRPHRLTSIAAPIEQMARRGAELLADRILNPHQPSRTLRLGCSVFDGGTVRKLPSQGDTP